MPTGPSSSQSNYLTANEPNVTFTSILTTGDAVGGYRMAGIPDGLGAFSNGNGTITVLMNNELGATLGAVHAHGSTGAFVETLTIDAATLRVISAQDLANGVFLNPNGDGYVAGTTAWTRFCSGDFPGVNAFSTAGGLGSSANIYLTGEETSEGRAFAFVLDAAGRAKAYELPAFGNFGFENLVTASNTGAKTVVMTMDDSTPGQLYMYIGDKKAAGLDVDKAGLTGGQMYGIKVDGMRTEVSGTFLPNDRASFTLAALGDVSKLNEAGLETVSDNAGVTEFFRPEDGAWDPSHPNWFYFVTTSDINSNSKLWRLEFNDMSNPAAGGLIRNLLQGDEGQRMMDNITVSADGKLIIEEDPGNSPRFAKVWSYDPATDAMVQIGEHDNFRFSGAVPPFNQDEESSGVIDVTSLLGNGSNQVFLLDVQAHYTNPDPTLAEGGQLLAMTIEAPRNGDAGADAVNGGAAGDTLFGLAGADTIRGGSGADLLSGDAGDDIVNGNKGDDQVRGAEGNDTLYGGQGADTVYGGIGDDRISGDLGNDILYGEAGADRFVARAGGGADWIIDFKSSEGDRIQIAPGVVYTVTSFQGQALIDLGGGATIGLAGVSVAQMGDWLVVA